MDEFYGKYRGKVVNNIDPQRQGRLEVTVPSIYANNKRSWAMPCVPYAGPGVGLFLIPPIGANIWVEFEGGDIDFPIWSGCFWKEGQLPQEASNSQVKLLKVNGITLKMIETPGSGSLTLEATSPAVSKPLSLKFDGKGITLSNSIATISLADSGIQLSQGSHSIEISAGSVSINKGALEII